MLEKRWSPEQKEAVRKALDTDNKESRFAQFIECMRAEFQIIGRKPVIRLEYEGTEYHLRDFLRAVHNLNLISQSSFNIFLDFDNFALSQHVCVADFNSIVKVGMDAIILSHTKIKIKKDKPVIQVNYRAIIKDLKNHITEYVNSL